ncbi:T3SS effector HopA1 family protein, partial [Streptococcus suis]
VRLYWNVHAAGGAVFVGIVTAVLNRYAIPFDLKITTARGDFARRDNAVLYLAQDALAVAWLALSAAMPALRPTLNADVPLFALKVAPGVGFAEDLGNGESFGSARCALVAAALLGARRGDRFDPDTFATRFAQIA